MENVLNVLAQSSDYYAPFTGVMLTSLFENNTDIPEITIYFLNDGLSNDNLSKLQELVAQYSRKLVLIDTGKMAAFLSSVGTPLHLGSYATYYKLFVIPFLDASVEGRGVERLLYLDGDTIVNASLRPLLSLDFEGNPLAMVRQLMSEKFLDCLGLTCETYWQAGVMLLNCKKWMEEDCTGRIVEHMKNVHASYPMVDQDILSILFGKSVKALPPKYNFNMEGRKIYETPDQLKKIYGPHTTFYDEQTIADAIENPVIIHLFHSFSKRPWYKNSGNPAAELWDYYLKKSPWADFEYLEGELSFIFKMNRLCYKYLPKGAYAFVKRMAVDYTYMHSLKKCGLV